MASDKCDGLLYGATLEECYRMNCDAARVTLDKLGSWFQGLGHVALDKCDERSEMSEAWHFTRGLGGARCADSASECKGEK